MAGEFLNQIRKVSYPESEVVQGLKKHIGQVVGNGKTETSFGMGNWVNYTLYSEQEENEYLKFLKDEGFFCREDEDISHFFIVSW